jgi:hypothetical protein
MMQFAEELRQLLSECGSLTICGARIPARRTGLTSSQLRACVNVNVLRELTLKVVSV